MHTSMALLSSLQDARRGVRLSCDPIDHPTAGYIDRNHLNYGVRTDSPGVYLPSWLTAFLLGVGALSLLAGSLEAAELITCGEAAGCAVIVLWWVIDVIEAWLPQQLAAVAAAASSAAATPERNATSTGTSYCLVAPTISLLPPSCTAMYVDPSNEGAPAGNPAPSAPSASCCGVISSTCPFTSVNVRSAVAAACPQPTRHEECLG
jgi:hypothetical protein